VSAPHQNGRPAAGGDFTVGATDEFRILPGFFFFFFCPEEPLLSPRSSRNSGAGDWTLPGGGSAHGSVTASPPSVDREKRCARELLARQTPTLDTVDGRAETHDRLTAHSALSAQCVSALTLPPRRLIEPRIAVGRHADGNHAGAPPEQIVRSIALRRMEFLRRYAEHECFLRRELPANRNPRRAGDPYG